MWWVMCGEGREREGRGGLGVVGDVRRGWEVRWGVVKSDEWETRQYHTKSPR